MAPRKHTIEEQQEEFRQTLENFTQGLHEALQHAIENALTTVLQHQQNPSRDRRDEDDRNLDDELHENLFAIPVQQEQEHQLRQRHDNNRNIVPYNNNGSNRWEAGFKIDIPEFSGSISPEEFIDWLSVVEEILEFKKVPDDVRVSLVATRFKGRAMAWWTQLKESRFSFRED